ncbi:ASCH domain-containing protein [Lactococcus fujiensis]|uniref:ASCH domain-containing protein n=1 Tax=Lactococcus fujiensis TaxID=610251 RepID=UPI0006D035ED|nr:ASCH domain-containing protein [Lactococcus fujiensis]
MKYENFIKEADLKVEDFRAAFAFGNDGENISDPKMADELLDELLKGRKTATASAVEGYEENEPFPIVDGRFDIVLNGKGEPIAAITNTRVYQTSFDQVTADHARREGEGDLSLAYWRQAHEAFWRQFDLYRPNMPVLCEEFEVIYSKSK